MPKINENQILHRLKFLSKIKPTPTATNRTIQKVHDALIKEQQAPKVRTWRIIIKSPITKLAVAACVIITAGILLVHLGPGEQADIPTVSQTTKSPAELVTMASFNFAYRRGGMQAVEEICDKAFNMVGPRPARLSVSQLLEDLNGNGKNPERTKL